VKLLDIYLVGATLTLAGLVLAAAALRRSHSMRVAAVILLALAAGAFWPIFALGALQLGLLAIGDAIRAGRRTDDEARDPAGAEVEHAMPANSLA
jgi:hypothetical protein